MSAFAISTFRPWRTALLNSGIWYLLSLQRIFIHRRVYAMILRSAREECKKYC
nr:MAG TPA: hypothetical protein [Caudoviricetes sp.]